MESGVDSDQPPTARPRLRSQVRIRWDSVRQRHVLLMPEKVVLLNETGAAILQLCNGERTFEEIVHELSRRYGGADVEQDVAEFLQQAAERGWLEPWAVTR